MRLNGTFEIEHVDGTVILTALTDLGELELENVKKRFEETLSRLSRRHVKNVIVDLSHADYYGSSALAFFVALWKLVRSSGGEFALCNVSPHGLKTLNVTHLDRLWEIFDSKDDAMRAILGAHSMLALRDELSTPVSDLVPQNI